MLTSDSLKIVINAIYGKLNFELGFLYDPMAALKVVINGQLFLLMLIERLEDKGFKVVSANTDGVTAFVDNDKKEEYMNICSQWEIDTKMELDYTYYEKIVRNNVNNYMAVTKEGVKTKGKAFLTKIDLSGGYNSPIVGLAVYNYFINNIPINFNGFYYFEDNAWKNVNKFNTEGLNPVLNFVDVKENPFTNKVYGATTEGLVEYNYNTITVFDATNSLIKEQFAGGTHQYITGIGFDLQGNVWMVNSQTTEPLIIYTRSGEWYQYPLSFGGNLKYHHLFVDSRSQKWVTLRGKGISVFPSSSLNSACLIQYLPRSKSLFLSVLC